MVSGQYGKGDYEVLRKMMSGTDWEEQLDGKTVEQAWATVRSQLEAPIASCIPKKTNRPGDARSRKPWNTLVTIGKVKMKITSIVAGGTLEKRKTT